MSSIMLEYNCKTCGYVGKRKHEDIYDCCDYVNPMWMKEWLVRMKKREKTQTVPAQGFKKWCKDLRA